MKAFEEIELRSSKLEACELTANTGTSAADREAKRETGEALFRLILG